MGVASCCRVNVVCERLVRRDPVEIHHGPLTERSERQAHGISVPPFHRIPGALDDSENFISCVCGVFTKAIS